jgi:hypothetical protein
VAAAVSGSSGVLRHGPAARSLPRFAALSRIVLAALLCVALMHAAGLVLDAVAVIRSPLQMDYGEGIVWQQAALIPGPLAYRSAPGLPLIVFHYTPLYHLAARAALAALPVMPDLLAAGRLVSSLATLALVPLVAWAALLATPAEDRRRALPVLAIVGCSLVLTAMMPVHLWGVLMRVDMLALAFGVAGLVAAALAEGRLWGTVAALLLCLAAVFTKQSMVSFGITAGLLSLLRRPRPAACATLLVAAVGGALVLGLQAATGGGFLQNIIGGNLNRLTVWVLLQVLPIERVDLVLFAAMLGATAWLAHWVIAPRWAGCGAMPGWRRVSAVAAAIGRADVVTWRRGLVVVQTGLSCLVLVTLLKSGGAVNYLLELCVSGCTAAAVVAAMLLADGRHPRGASLLLLALTVGAAFQPWRMGEYRSPDARLAQDSALVDRMRRAGGPVASEDMVLLMRAGLGVVYEPAIATELAAVGRWDETPLVAMIGAHGFAFMLTEEGSTRPTAHRSPAVTAAMLAAYPKVRMLRPKLWLRERD